jgi:short-subunit dehydrogenase
MQNKVIFITGASSGIGYATALAFARRGAHVAVTARRADRLAALEAAVAALPTPHGEVLALTADVRDGAALTAAVEGAVARFGRLDALIANAGIGHRGAVVDALWEDLDTVIRTNIDGVLHSIRAAAPALRQSRGHIVIVSSVTAGMTAPYTAIYAATKTFVSSLAASLRLELEADGVTVTDLRLGRTATEFNDKRLGGKRASSGVVSSMPVERVAEAVVRAVERRERVTVLRPLDRLIMLGSALVPGVIGRLAKRQYK